MRVLLERALPPLCRYELKPLILPICFFAGKVQQALDNGSVDAVGLGVLADAVNLFLVLLHKIGLINDAAFSNCRKRGPGTGISLLNQPQNHYHTDVRTCRSFAAPCWMVRRELALQQWGAHH